MASKHPELQIHSQLCSLCTLGSKSQWTKVYFVTLIVAWVVYFIKNMLDMFFIRDVSSNGLSINIIVSLIAWIVSLVVFSNASADDQDCMDHRTNGEIEETGSYHENASLLLVSMCVGYFSLISVMYCPTNSESRSYFAMSVTILFCLIFLMYAAVSKDKSLHACSQVTFTDSYMSSSSSSVSSVEHDCTSYIVPMCNKSATSRCRNQMKKHNHKAFSIKYVPTNHSEWSVNENKPNWKDITNEMGGVLSSFYATPFQIHSESLIDVLTSTQHYLKAYSFVEWDATPIPVDRVDIADDTDSAKVTKLIETLDANDGNLTHNDVKDLSTGLASGARFAGKWHQKEIYYTPIDIGNDQYILQRVSSIPLNASLYETSLSEYMTAHHESIVNAGLLKTQQLDDSMTYHPLYGMTMEGNYDNPTELEVIQSMKQVFEINSYVELTVGKQSVYLTPSKKSKMTTVTCNTYDKTPSSADIQAVPNTEVSADTLDSSCSNRNHKSIYYESESSSGSDRRFLLNISITSLFAAVAFLRPTLVTFESGRLSYTNLFSWIAICQMFMFFYVATGYYSSSELNVFFYISIVFSFVFTFGSFIFYQRKKGKTLDAIFIKTFSSLCSVLFNVFMLCHLIDRLSTDTSSEPNEWVPPWYILALVFLLIFLALPFDEVPRNHHELMKFPKTRSYIAKIVSTGLVRLVILFLFIICTSFFSNNYFDIPRSVRLIFVIILSITLGFLTFPKFESVFDEYSPHMSEHKTSGIVVVILSLFFTLNNFAQSFSNSNTSNLYTAASALLVGLVSLITTQLIFGKKAFFLVAIMCVIPFLTLYQYEAVKQSPSDVCAVKVTFGESSGSTMLYNSKNCGDGSSLSPDADCQFSRIKIYSLQMLDKNSNCQVILHENVGEKSGKSVWDLKRNDLKFQENCSDDRDAADSCFRTPDTHANAITVKRRCGLRVYPASNSIDPDTKKPIPMGFHLRIKADKLGVRGLKFDESDFEVWVDNTETDGERRSRRAESTDDPKYQPAAWKNLKMDVIKVDGSGFRVLGYEKNTDITGYGLSWIYIGTKPPRSSPSTATSTDSPASSGEEYEVLVNAALSSALSRRTFFTVEEWSSFNVNKAVTPNTYVQSGSKYYKPNEFFEGSRQEFVSGINEISPPKNFDSFVIIENGTDTVWPEILPFQISNMNSAYINIIWRVVFYLCLFLIPVAGVSKGFKSESVIFLGAFLSALLIGIVNKGIYNNGMGLGGEGLTGSNASAMDPNVFTSLFTIAVIFAVAVEMSFFTTGVERVRMIVGSVLLFGIVLLATASTLPILICCGILGACLAPSLTGRNQIVAMCLPLLLVVAVITSWSLGRGTLPCEALGFSPRSGNGDIEYGSCYTPTGNFWEDMWYENSHFFINIGYTFEDFFTGVTFQKIANEFKSVLAKLGDDNIKSFCNKRDTNNPLCVASKRNKCKFSYCISPPEPIQMSDFDDTLINESQITQMQKSRCNSHRLFHKSALKAISDDKASAKQKYCVNYHKNDDCGNICKDYWKNDSDPVTRETLAKLESRLEVIDDSVLEISPEEWVQMKREKLGV